MYFIASTCSQHGKKMDADYSLFSFCDSGIILLIYEHVLSFSLSIL